ncbi:MAG TPA: fused response regulator/phosphatase [Azospirillaceae bacterium]|nr:fused response regulator/phosphatase [Azospirillaceae bacterium]
MSGGGAPGTAAPGARDRSSYADARVLVVDDSRFSRETLARFLAGLGIGSIEFAADGAEGLARLEAAGADLVLVDADMPRMDGFELCRRIRAAPALSGLPVLLLTSPATDPEGVRCLEAGASDIIGKPLNPAECMARVRLHLEKHYFYRNLADFHRRVEGDLRLARNMQLSLIPDQRAVATVAASHPLEVEGHFEPSDELGGDFWTLFELGGGRVGILVADFSGHGISAAINTFRFHTLIARIQPHGYEPAEWLTMLNRPLKDLLPVGQFATCIYCIVDTLEDTLSYAAAGAPSPILWQDGRPTLLDASGLMLGVATSPLLTSDTIAFPKGASLLLYSDAMTEATDLSGHLLGEEGLLDLVSASFAGGGGRLGRLLSGFDRRVSRPLADDLTAICVTRV